MTVADVHVCNALTHAGTHRVTIELASALLSRVRLWTRDAGPARTPECEWLASEDVIAQLANASDQREHERRRRAAVRQTLEPLDREDRGTVEIEYLQLPNGRVRLNEIDRMRGGMRWIGDYATLPEAQAKYRQHARARVATNVVVPPTAVSTNVARLPTVIVDSRPSKLR